MTMVLLCRTLLGSFEFLQTCRQNTLTSHGIHNEKTPDSTRHVCFSLILQPLFDERAQDVVTPPHASLPLLLYDLSSDSRKTTPLSLLFPGTTKKVSERMREVSTLLIVNAVRVFGLFLTLLCRVRRNEQDPTDNRETHESTLLPIRHHTAA
ncbi:hypothetical protein BDR07DRAFT_599512 [Suillus spraguei]|nr:hypothetical protein BDR07DRAFT_599512 [Suillus spraguei]